MSEEAELRASIGDLISLVVHDLRNPVATISANVSFVREVGAGDDEDSVAALEDIEMAIGDLMRGLEQLGWIGRWIACEPAFSVTPGDARKSVEEAVRMVGAEVRLDLPEEPVLVAAGGTALSRVTEILLRNAITHADVSTVRVVLSVDEEAAELEVRDGGQAVAADLRSKAFTIDGQQGLKVRTDGRYSRVVGLLAARAIADGMGASIEADGEDGEAVFRVRIPV